MVSVILPVFNGKPFVEEAVMSVLNQCHCNFELIIVDNASTDGTAEVLAAFARRDKRVRVITNAENIGLGRSLNLAIDEAKGDFIARMDADDISCPNRLSEQVAYLECHPKVVAVSSWAERFGDAQGTIRSACSADLVRAMALFVCPIVHPAVMMRRATLNYHGIRYRPVSPVEDFDLWTRLLSVGDVEAIGEVLLLYRVQARSLTARTSEVRRGVLRGVLRQSLECFFKRHKVKVDLSDDRIEMHARFSGHEKMTWLEVKSLLPWLVWLVWVSGSVSVFWVVCQRCVAYMVAAVQGRLLDPPTDVVMDVSAIIDSI